jgi:hypothetical protein
MSASVVPSENDEIGEPPINMEAREHTLMAVFAGIAVRGLTPPSLLVVV